MSTTEMQTVKLILDLICSYFHVTPKQLESPCRRRELVIPRHYAFHLIRRQTSLGVATIGLLFHRCPSTITYALKALANDLTTNAQLRRELATPRQ